MGSYAIPVDLSDDQKRAIAAAPQPQAPAITVPAQPMPDLGQDPTPKPQLVNKFGHAIPVGRVEGIPGKLNPTEDGTPGTYNPVNPHLSKIASLWSDADNIHNPFVRVLAKIGAGAARAGDAILGAAAPRLAAALPGTTLNHTLQEQNAAKASQAQATLRETNAKADAEEQAPELAEEKNELAAEKQNEAAEKNAHQDQDVLAQHGYKRDVEGKVVPLTYAEMSPQQQAITDLKSAQEEVAAAQKAYKDAQTQNIPAQMEMAKARIATAQRNAGTAAARLGLAQDTFNARYRGTDAQGNPLPGAMELDDNTPVGSVFQQNVRPTGQERNKADLANSAHDQLQTIKSIVQNRPDIFGPAAGRKTDFNVWVGSQDPDAQRFRAARTIAGDHLAGVFGGRSEAALTALDTAIGHFKDNPAAVVAGIDQLDHANRAFQKAGHVHVAGAGEKKGGGEAPKKKDSLGIL